MPPEIVIARETVLPISIVALRLPDVLERTVVEVVSDFSTEDGSVNVTEELSFCSEKRPLHEIIDAEKNMQRTIKAPKAAGEKQVRAVRGSVDLLKLAIPMHSFNQKNKDSDSLLLWCVYLKNTLKNAGFLLLKKQVKHRTLSSSSHNMKFFGGLVWTVWTKFLIFCAKMRVFLLKILLL